MDIKITNVKKLLLKDINFALRISIENYQNEQVLLDKVAKELNNGTKLIHLSPPKNNNVKNFISVAKKIRQLCSMFSTLLIVESRSDLAKIIDSDGIYLTQNDAQLADIQKIIDHEKIFCTSCEAFKDSLDDFDYVVVQNNQTNALKSILDGSNVKIINIKGDNNEHNC